ncbi:hypothetical protein F5884DRAFT_903937 [Xylogone sp. PMI_703]|nr:hypothetical protein F5884DRAFT_903937 [Xylogone sp. PMI_703]
MRIVSFGAVLGVTSAVNAAAVEQRAVGNSTCEWAIVGAAKGMNFTNSARPDCTKNVVSVLGTVYASPPAVTVTSTRTIQIVTVSTETLTLTDIIETASTALATETETDISTLYQTLTQDQTSTLLVTSTPLVTTSVTVVETITPSTTATVYTPTYVMPSAVAKRTVSEPCVPATPTIPAYASACSDFAEYSAACSLLGVSGTVLSTTVLPTPTITSLASTTITSTSIVTVTTQSDVVSTDLQTSTIHVTENGFLTFSTIVYKPETETLTVAAPTSTVAVSIKSATLSNLKFQSGDDTSCRRPIHYLRAPTRPADGVYGSPSSDGGSLFTIDDQSRLVALDLEAIATANNLANYYIEFWTMEYYNLDKVPMHPVPIQFAVHEDLSLTFSIPNSNVHDYTYYAALNQFWYSAPGVNGFPTYTANVGDFPDG